MLSRFETRRSHATNTLTRQLQNGFRRFRLTPPYFAHKVFHKKIFKPWHVSKLQKAAIR